MNMLKLQITKVRIYKDNQKKKSAVMLWINRAREDVADQMYVSPNSIDLSSSRPERTLQQK